MTEKSVHRSGEVCDDPYAAFLAEQRKRDAEWFSNQTTKKSKAGNAASTEPKEPAEDITALKKELDAKNAECAALKCQVQELQQVGISAVEAQNKTQENFYKVKSNTFYRIDVHYWLVPMVNLYSFELLSDLNYFILTTWELTKIANSWCLINNVSYIFSDFTLS